MLLTETTRWKQGADFFIQCLVFHFRHFCYVGLYLGNCELPLQRGRTPGCDSDDTLWTTSRLVVDGLTNR